MLDLIMAEGSIIQFEQTTFNFKPMPKRPLWRLMDQCRTMLRKDKLDLPGLVSRVVHGEGSEGEEGLNLSAEEAITLMLDVVSGIEHSFMEQVQSQLFQYCEFTRGVMTAPMPIQGPMEEYALEEVSPFEMYILMGRGLYIYYKKDIVFWVAKLQEERSKNAEQESNPAPENVSDEHVAAYRQELHVQMAEQMANPTQETEG